MKKLLLSSLLLSFIISGSLLAQNNVGIGTNSPNSNALLHLDNNGNPRGLLLPIQDISTFTLGAGDVGIMVINSVDNKLYFWDGTQWLTATSEWTLSGADLYNINTGNVGIGTTNPQSKLAVNGNMAIGAAYATTAAPANSLIVGGNIGIGTQTPNSELQFRSTTNNRKLTLFESTNNDHQFYGFGINSSVLRYQVSSTAANHVFYAGVNSTTSSELMRLTGTGRLIIPGTTDASGTSGSGVLEIASSLRIDGNEIITNTGSSLFINQDNGGDVIMDAGTFQVDASADRVGIGQATPDTKLEVVGDVMATDAAFVISTLGADIGASGNVDHIWHNDGTNTWHFVSDAAYKTANNSSSTVLAGSFETVNTSNSSCSVILSPFVSCNAVTSNIDFDFQGSFTGSGSGTMGDMSIQAASAGFGTIGSVNPTGTFRFLVDGAIVCNVSNGIYPGTDGGGSCGISSAKWSTVYANNGTINTSDRRHKTNIQGIEYGLETVLALNPVSFSWKKDLTSKKLGLIAQEVQALLPEVVEVGDDKDNTLGVFYSDIIPVLIKAIQEQQEEIEYLKSRVNKL